MTEVPLYARWYRARLGWTFNDKLHPVLQIDPAWPHPDRAINAQNDSHRRFLTEYLTSQLGDRPDLVERVLPSYPVYGKRILLDTGWYRTLRRDNVTLETDGIGEVGADRIVTELGTEHPADVIVLATGFDVARFLTSFEIYGRGEQSLKDRWGDDGSAYLGTVVPGYPNFFCLYGPNLQPGHGGSIIFTLERQIHYVIDVLRQMALRGGGVVEVRSDVTERYNAETDARLSKMVWTHPGMTNYYRNSRGRIVVNSPYRHSEWWGMTDTHVSTSSRSSRLALLLRRRPRRPARRLQA